AREIDSRFGRSDTRFSMASTECENGESDEAPDFGSRTRFSLPAIHRGPRRELHCTTTRTRADPTVVHGTRAWNVCSPATSGQRVVYGYGTTCHGAPSTYQTTCSVRGSTTTRSASVAALAGLSGSRTTRVFVVGAITCNAGGQRAGG